MPLSPHTESWRLDAGSARGWLDRFFEYWRTSDAAGGSALFALDAVFTGSVYEERWPEGKRMHGRAEIAAYWQHVTEGRPFIQGDDELWAANGPTAHGRLEADLRWPAEDRWHPRDHAFEAVFAPEEDSELSCRVWWEWKLDPPRRLWHREPHPLDRP